jgi:argininosuccinate lyase
MEVTLVATNLPSGYFRDMQLTKEIYVPAFKELADVLRMVKEGIEQMWINRDILSNDIYKYLFTVEDVNDAVAAGVPFRDAYREVGMRVQEGTYEHDDRTLNHTHEGSIGNLCLDEIAAKSARHKFDYAEALAAEKKLME